MGIVDNINQQILELWTDTFNGNDHVRLPMIYPEMSKGALLFVGLNPSFGEKWSFVKGEGFENFEPNQFFIWRKLSTADIEKAKRIEKLARAEYSFFKKPLEIADHVGQKMEHIDLFFYRETDQKAFHEIIYANHQLNEFGRKQLELSSCLIDGLEPRAIVVINAFASHMLGDHDGELNARFDSKFDEELGTYTISVNGRRIPCFLASMLSGQRAMDVFSYERLKWHVKQCLQI